MRRLAVLALPLLIVVQPSLPASALDGKGSSIKAKLTVASEQKLAGVGLRIGRTVTGKILVLSVGPNAKAAGVRQNDQIIRVNNSPVAAGMSPNAVVGLIRGTEGTPVSITIRRQDTELTFSVNRTHPSGPITAARLSPNVGYVRISELTSADLNDQLQGALERLSQCKSLVLDLRDNPGGLIHNVIRLADKFLSHGVIVSTIDADGYKNPQLATDNTGDIRIPLVVLVNLRTMA